MFSKNKNGWNGIFKF